MFFACGIVLGIFEVPFWPLILASWSFGLLVFWPLFFGLLVFWPQCLVSFPICILAFVFAKEAKVQTGKKGQTLRPKDQEAKKEAKTIN